MYNFSYFLFCFVDRINVQCERNLIGTENTVHSHNQLPVSESQELKNNQTISETVISERINTNNSENNNFQEYGDEEKQRNLQTDNISSDISQITSSTANIEENISKAELDKGEIIFDITNFCFYFIFVFIFRSLI